MYVYVVEATFSDYQEYMNWRFQQLEGQPGFSGIARLVPKICCWSIMKPKPPKLIRAQDCCQQVVIPLSLQVVSRCLLFCFILTHIRIRPPKEAPSFELIPTRFLETSETCHRLRLSPLRGLCRCVEIAPVELLRCVYTCISADPPGSASGGAPSCSA